MKNKTIDLSHFSRQRERGSNRGIAFLIRVMNLTGPRFVKLLVVPVALYYFLSSPDARKVSKEYLLRLRQLTKVRGLQSNLPGGPLRWLTFKHILSFSRSMVDRVYVWSAGAEAFHYQVEGQDVMDDALREGHHGAVFLVSHLGNFDLAIARSETTPNSRFNAVLDTGRSRIYNQYRHKIFESGQIRFIEPDALTPVGIISLAQRAADGEVIVIAADRAVNASERNSVPVDFLGGQALFPSGPYLMAHLLEVPVYCLFAMEKHNGCLVRFEIFEQKVNIPRHQRQRALRRYAQKFAARLERECLEFPLQWYNFYDFWASPPQATQDRHDQTS